MMASVGQKNTKPEILLRRYLHAQGLRYGLHAKDLPGSPDIVFRARRTAVFVHGCFWHRCPHCAVGEKNIESNTGYWLPKLERNQERDTNVRAELKSRGWQVIVAWECQLKNRAYLRKIAAVLRRRLVRSKA
jgi:DNA mismatch endonuclease (patch repair protein)